MDNVDLYGVYKNTFDNGVNNKLICTFPTVEEARRFQLTYCILPDNLEGYIEIKPIEFKPQCSLTLINLYRFNLYEPELIEVNENVAIKTTDRVWARYTEIVVYADSLEEAEGLSKEFRHSYLTEHFYLEVTGTYNLETEEVQWVESRKLKGHSKGLTKPDIVVNKFSKDDKGNPVFTNIIIWMVEYHEDLYSIKEQMLTLLRSKQYAYKEPAIQLSIDLADRVSKVVEPYRYTLTSDAQMNEMLTRSKYVWDRWFSYMVLNDYIKELKGFIFLKDKPYDEVLEANLYVPLLIHIVSDKASEFKDGIPLNIVKELDNVTTPSEFQLLNPGGSGMTLDGQYWVWQEPAT